MRNSLCPTGEGKWLGRELNPRHEDFQSSALPTELPSRNGKLESINQRTGFWKACLRAEWIRFILGA